MKIVTPKPFTFEGGKRAVLLLHGFTGNTADVRMLGRYLQDKGYTCHAPLYKGHGRPPEELVESGPEDWWSDVLEGYHHLKESGYEQIAAAGISLGGLMSLKLGYTVPVKGIVPMCVPMKEQTEENILRGFLAYAREYKKHEGKSEDQIKKELDALHPQRTIQGLGDLINDVRKHIDLIYAPTFVVQGRLDHMIDLESADIIHDEVESTFKKIKWYEESGHAITLDKERDMLHRDVHQFLEELDWSVD